jgi:SAM-dependent methyltransferase
MHCSPTRALCGQAARADLGCYHGVMDGPERRADGTAGPVRPRHAEDFESIYAGTPAWDIGRPQPAFTDLADAGALRGRLLDIGCGTGEHALLAAGIGLDATGVDMAPTALAIAERKARERGVAAHFVQHDALDLASLGRQFDTVLDCGLFHIFDDDDRPRFVESLGAVVVPGGRYYMLCFSELQPGDWGPRRVTQREITDSFSVGWNVDTIEPATLEVNIDPDGVRAWRATISRT